MCQIGQDLLVAMQSYDRLYIAEFEPTPQARKIE
jgi:hypothetical protein